MLTLLVIALLAQIAPPLGGFHGDYILVNGDNSCSRTNDTIDEDTLRDRYGRHFFWYVLDGKRYVVLDRGALDDIEAVFEPQRKLGRQQSALGRRQSELGRQQSAYGREQSRLGQEQSRIAGRSAYDPEARERMRELGQQMREQGDKMRALGDKMRDLGAEMSELGEQMKDEGKKIDRKLQEMMRGFADRGIAQEVRR